ncbi:MAG: hypothetical protein ACFB51_22330, partial [Anaerolineae bacterium]
MPWEAAWLDEQETIILVRVSQPWEWDQLDELVIRYHRWISVRPYGVAVLYDVRDVGPIRPGIILRARQYLASQPPNLTRVVIAGATRFMVDLMRIGARSIMRDHQVHFTTTVEEAQQLIAALREQS